MRVEELIIEGFKSYAVRTHITGWDSAFNAITGLNGSGKSNILDAICFVLGIKNLAAVRANNLVELVYKRGQAGVTKASVTIVFNNSDRAKSPVGYENCQQISVTRQILLAGKTKYLINGHTAQQHAVETLFQSVQLNVNNPHFLIMQGRITKVLNMKPQEVLSMIEEASGTRMFEERKEKALNTMAKKDKKVAEITTILNEEITPKLDRLREEKRAYLEFQKTEIEIDRLRRLTIAYQYAKCQKQLNQSDKVFEEKKDRVRDIRVEMDRLATETEHLEQEIKQLNKKRQQESGAGEQKKQEFESIRIEHEKRSIEVRKAEELLQTLATGLSAQEGHENGYMEQLQEAKRQIVQCDTEVEQSRVRKTHLEREVAELRPKAKQAEKENKTLMAEVEAARQQVEKLDKQLKSLAYDPDQEATLLKQQSQLQLSIERLQERIDQMASQISAIDFIYSDPTPNFDRAKVKGVVAELVQLPEEHSASATALEVCAGGRLYNVVVENETVGSQLLKHGKLQKRVTIIPLNKVQPYLASSDRVNTAQQLAPGKVNLALSLIGYEKQVTKAMEYVFGGTLICEDSETAQKVTFDRQVRLKSVTIDGDVYDPAGTLQGGSKPQSGGLLIKIQALHEARQQLATLQAELAQVERKLASMEANGSKYKQLSHQRELKLHQQSLAQEQLSSSPQAQLLNALQQAQEQLTREEAIVADAQTRRKEAAQRCKHIEKEMSDFKQNRDGKLEELSNKLEKEKRQMAQANSTQELEEMKATLRTERDLQSGFAEEIKEIEVIHKRKSSQMTELQVEMQLGSIKTEREAEALEQQHPWIFEQRDQFGKPDTQFDFSSLDPKKSREHLSQLETKFDSLRKKINVKVMNTLDSTEKREVSLKAMLSTVLRDKRKIQETIEELDQYKKEALEKTWIQVNRDFGEIFGELLDGNTCKLEPPEGKSLTEGLEVKVCLGSVWKNSLTELSGGQRSLVALALILSLLQYKPAPMYILDEIDAALDLSHTQNIGQLFRTRFKGSQFIVVSLKEGMFNNANVLFRARFRDGVSVVEPTKPTWSVTSTLLPSQLSEELAVQSRVYKKKINAYSIEC
ncbi:structural maintenance of chromosome protein 2 [Syncephalis plumigaleata]|nr:structural maintenance of chromosome protein 2 [Syncephalis plumigaleata]